MCERKEAPKKKPIVQTKRLMHGGHCDAQSRLQVRRPFFLAASGGKGGNS